MALAVYLALAFDPVNFGAWPSIATRDSWYSSLKLLLIATVFLAVYAALAHARLPWVVAASLIAGVTPGVFSLCREEAIYARPTDLSLSTACFHGGFKIGKVVRVGVKASHVRGGSSRYRPQGSAEGPALTARPC